MNTIALFCITIIGLSLIGGFSTAGFANWQPILTSTDPPLPTPLDYLIWSLNSFYTFNRASMQKLEVNETFANKISVKKLFVDEMDVRNITILEGITTINGVPTLNSANVLTNMNIAGTTFTSILVVNGTSTFNAITATNVAVNGPISANGALSGTSVQSFGPISATGAITTTAGVTAATLQSTGTFYAAGNSEIVGTLLVREAVEMQRELLVSRNAVFGQELFAVGNVTSGAGYLKGPNAQITGLTETGSLTVTNSINAIGGISTNSLGSFGDVYLNTAGVLRANFFRPRDNGDVLRFDPLNGGFILFENLANGGVVFNTRADANSNDHWISARFGSDSRAGSVVAGNFWVFDTAAGYSESQQTIGGHANDLTAWRNLYLNTGASTIIGKGGLPGTGTATDSRFISSPFPGRAYNGLSGPAKLAVDGEVKIVGNLAIGGPGTVVTVDNRLEVNGNLNVDGAFTNPSDPRLKKNIVVNNRTQTLERLMNTRIYNYQYTDFYANRTGVNNSKIVTGFLAAGDLLENFPEVIEPIPFQISPNITENYNGVEKIKLIPILWDGLREVETKRREEKTFSDQLFSQLFAIIAQMNSTIIQQNARIVSLENSSA